MYRGCEYFYWGWIAGFFRSVLGMGGRDKLVKLGRFRFCRL